MKLGLVGTGWIVRQQIARMERGIDTSGVATLDYGSFKAVSVAAKDCASPISYVIQGNDGYLQQTTSANFCGPITLHLNDGTEEHYDENGFTGMWDAEFASFKADVASGSTEHCYQILDETLLVSRVQTDLRLSAGVRFPADEQQGGHKTALLCGMTFPTELDLLPRSFFHSVRIPRGAYPIQRRVGPN